MREYLVMSDYGQRNNAWVVSAKDAKDAINRVWDKQIEPMNANLRAENKKYGDQGWRLCTRAELYAKSIATLHSRDGDVISVN